MPDSEVGCTHAERGRSGPVQGIRHEHCYICPHQWHLVGRLWRLPEADLEAGGPLIHLLTFSDNTLSLHQLFCSCPS